MDWDNLDYSDPCALLAQLRPVLYRLAAGGADEEIEGSDGRRVRLQRGSVPQLRQLINELERDCRKAQGGRRRHALVGRFRTC